MLMETPSLQFVGALAAVQQVGALSARQAPTCSGDLQFEVRA